jgi:hypothetical protein
VTDGVFLVDYAQFFRLLDLIGHFFLFDFPNTVDLSSLVDFITMIIFLRLVDFVDIVNSFFFVESNTPVNYFSLVNLSTPVDSSDTVDTPCMVHLLKIIDFLTCSFGFTLAFSFSFFSNNCSRSLGCCCGCIFGVLS